jgi:hypothetical protein
MREINAGNADWACFVARGGCKSIAFDYNEIPRFPGFIVEHTVHQLV